MSGLPVHDWQFWVVTVAAVVAAWWLLKPHRWWRRGRTSRSRPKRVDLTVGGRSVGGD